METDLFPPSRGRWRYFRGAGMKSLGPCFPFYHDDYLGGTRYFDDRQHGAYLLLLIEQWRAGFLCNNPTKLRRIAATSLRSTDDRWLQVLEKFPVCEDGNRRNKRMDVIRCERMAFIEHQSRAGLASAEKRRATTVQPPLQPEGQPKGNLPSPSPSPDKNTPPPRAREDRKYATEHEAAAKLIPAPHVLDYETFLIVHRLYGLDPAHTAEELQALLRTEPANRWDQYGVTKNLGYLIETISKRHKVVKPTGANRPEWAVRKDAEQRKKAAEEEIARIKRRGNHPSDEERAEICRLMAIIKAANATLLEPATTET